jgi:hypothetical protein
MIRPGKNDWVLNKRFEDKLLRQVFFLYRGSLLRLGLPGCVRSMRVFGRMGVFDR